MPQPRLPGQHPSAGKTNSTLIPRKREMTNAFSTLTHPSPMAPASVLYFLYSISSSLRNCSFLMQKSISTSNIYVFIPLWVCSSSPCPCNAAHFNSASLDKESGLHFQNKEQVSGRTNQTGLCSPSSTACLRETHCTSHTPASDTSKLCRTVCDSSDSMASEALSNLNHSMVGALLEENLQLSLPGYSTSRAMKPLMAKPSTGTTQVLACERGRAC